jgi:hypothetical protein
MASHLRLGYFLGGLDANSTLSSGYGHADSQLVFAGTYARYDRADSFLKAGLQLGYGSIFTTRWTNNNLVLSGIETSNATSNNWYISPELRAGHRFSLGQMMNGQVTLTPEAQVRYLFGSYAGYSESGGSDGFSVGNRAAQSSEEQLLIKLSHSSTKSGGTQVKTNLIAGLIGSQRIGSDPVNGQLLGQSIQFGQPGNNDCTGALAGLGIEITNGKTTVFAQGDYIAQQNGNDLSGRIGVNVRF